MRRKIPALKHLRMSEKAIREALRFIEKNYEEAKKVGINAIYENRLKLLFMPPRKRLSINDAKRIAIFSSALLFLEGEEYYEEVAQIIFELVYATEYAKKYGKVDFIRYAKSDKELEKIAEIYREKYLQSL
ncbi:MAG: hypothetical protein NDP19_06330, partial [Crenarchaeota archaeon]|nr:hypothetical protein [Thermoproteota archaeon]